MWLPETDKYFVRYKSGPKVGKFNSRCRLCHAWYATRTIGLSGYVPDYRVRPFVIEGVHKVGMSEFARRTNVNEHILKGIIERPAGRRQKKVVRRIFLEVISIRRKGEVRHRTDIAAGMLARGKADNHKVAAPEDLYRPLGDDYQERLDREAEAKRVTRANWTPEERERQRLLHNVRKKRLRDHAVRV